MTTIDFDPAATTLINVPTSQAAAIELLRSPPSLRRRAPSSTRVTCERGLGA